MESKNIEKTARPRGTDSAKIIPVIVTEGLIGRGTKEDPCRMQMRYWSLDGQLLATVDEMEVSSLSVGDGFSILDD